MNMKPSTVKDVAKKAGVSAMTVSRVLNGTGAVSEATKARVIEAASELHYYGNSVARSLRVNETKTIGVVLSDSSEMVLSSILRSIQDDVFTRIILGEEDIGAFDQFVADFYSLGGDEITREVNAWYKSHH